MANLILRRGGENLYFVENADFSGPAGWVGEVSSLDGEVLFDPGTLRSPKNRKNLGTADIKDSSRVLELLETYLTSPTQ